LCLRRWTISQVCGSPSLRGLPRIFTSPSPAFAGHKSPAVAMHLVPPAAEALERLEAREQKAPLRRRARAGRTPGRPRSDEREQRHDSLEEGRRGGAGGTRRSCSPRPKASRLGATRQRVDAVGLAIELSALAAPALEKRPDTVSLAWTARSRTVSIRRHGRSGDDGDLATSPAAVPTARSSNALSRLGHRRVHPEALPRPAGRRARLGCRDRCHARH